MHIHVPCIITHSFVFLVRVCLLNRLLARSLALTRIHPILSAKLCCFLSGFACFFSQTFSLQALPSLKRKLRNCKRRVGEKDLLLLTTKSLIPLEILDRKCTQKKSSLNCIQVFICSVYIFCAIAAGCVCVLFLCRFGFDGCLFGQHMRWQAPYFQCHKFCFQ